MLNNSFKKNILNNITLIYYCKIIKSFYIEKDINYYL